jgi:hypothetical protein
MLLYLAKLLLELGLGHVGSSGVDDVNNLVI